MASLTGQTIASSYEQILALPDGGGNTTTLVALTDGDGVNTFSLQLATTKTMINGSGNKLYFGDESAEYISGDTTDLTIASGRNINLTCASGDVVIPANIGLTFGTGEKIEGDSTDLTVTSGGKINLTATSDVVIPLNVGLIFGDGGEHIESDNTDLTITSGVDINLVASGDVVVGGSSKLEFNAAGSGEHIYGDGTDLHILSAGNLNLTSTIAEVAAIYLRENAGAAGTIKIHADQGTSVTEGAESITILSDAGGVGIRSTANLANAVNITVDGGSTSSMTLFNDQGTSATEGSASIQLLSDVGGINIKSGLNNANAILLTADGGTSETIKIHADRGTGAASIELVSDAGGITVNAGLDLVFTASGGDVTFNDNAGEIVSFDTSGNITALGDIVLNDGGSLKEADGTAAFTFDGSGHVTKIGQGTAGPAQDGYVLSWDNTNGRWTPVAGTELETSATSVPADGISQGSAAVNITTTSGDITLDTDDGDIILDAAGDDVIIKDAGTERFRFNLDTATSLDCGGNFTLNCTGSIVLDSGSTDGDISFYDDGTPWLKFARATNTTIYTPLNDTSISFMNSGLDQTYIKINNDVDSSTIPNGVQFPGKNGTSNCAIGGNSGENLVAGADYNTFIGEKVASAGTITNACDSNVGVGYQAMASLTSSKESVAVGHKAGYSLEGGDWNTAIGGSALYTNASGIRNTAVGYKSLYTLSSTTGNTAVGWSALESNTAGWNTAIGYRAMLNCKGDDSSSNTAVGNASLLYLAAHSASESSTHNVGVGSLALSNLGRWAGAGVSDNNVGIGYKSGDAVSTGGSNYEANKSTFIGDNCKAGATNGTNEIVIGADAVGNGTYTITLGTSAHTAGNHIQTDWTVASDVRIKKDIEDNDLGLSFINDLKPKKYKKLHPADWDEAIRDDMYKDGDRGEFDDVKVWDGLIAQDVKDAIDKSGTTFSGWSSGINGKQGLQYATLVVPLIKAVQELSSTVKALEAKVESLESASSSRTNVEL